jgi:hypothetical protein
MYVLDPDKGRRRRAIARDKAHSIVVGTGDAVRVVRRDAASRIKGLRARARHLFRRRALPDDLVLIERVRARMGRLVSHPHAIQVGAREGRVTLSGPILAHEASPLLRAVRTVWGVTDVDDRLVAHERPDSIPSLQGGSRRSMLRPAAFIHEHWPPALRLAAALWGGAMAFYGMRRRTLAGWTLTAAGLALTTRAVANAPTQRLAELARHPRVGDPQATDGPMTASPHDRASPDSAAALLH